MCSILYDPKCHFPADPGSGSYDGDYLPSEFLFRWHPLQLCFFEQPILDVERFLLRQSNIVVDRFGAAHHFDRAIIELGSNPRFGLVLAPCDHAQTRNQDDRRIRIPHRGRIRPLTAIIISRIVGPVFLEACLQFGFEYGGIFFRRIPISIERLYLCTEEVIGTTRPELRQSGGIDRIDKTQDWLVILNRADQAFFLADLTTQPGKNYREQFPALRWIHSLDPRSTERLRVTSLGFVSGCDIPGRLLD